MCKEVNNLIQMGVKGVVIGGLTENKDIDVEFIKRIKKQIETNKV